MRRFRGIFALGALALCAPAAAAAPAVGTPPRVQLRDFVCQRAVEPASRAISVTAVMRPLPGTVSMAERFVLLAEPAGSSSFAPMSEPGTDLGKWVAPQDPTLGRRAGDVWILTKPVVDLPAPASYRLRVEFRWTGAHHHVIGLAVHHTPSCHQPELRPDLLVRHIAPTLNRAGTATVYAVTVANAGAAAAAAFTVELASPGAQPEMVTVPGLAPHRETTLKLRGPVCATGSPPTVTVDPEAAVPDSDRANNVATASCTAATTPF